MDLNNVPLLPIKLIANDGFVKRNPDNPEKLLWEFPIQTSEDLADITPGLPAYHSCLNFERLNHL